MILQLNPPWHVVCPKGEGFAVAIIDYGVSLNPILLIALDDTRELLCVDTDEVRMSGNAMYQLPHPPIPERSI